jgi:2',3'-cyclic-nucleotide 2'-phosphodiesterase/3'-nucleotidase
MRLRFFSLIATSFFLQTCFFSEAQTTVNLKVIQTTDIHGAIFPFDFINNKAVNYGLSQVHSYVQKERQKNEEGVILLDNGDILQGHPTVYFANYIDSSSTHIVSQVMNYMRYDAATIGNHDIEVGPNIYNRLVNEFSFPWLSANTINLTTGQPYFKPYQIIERKGVKVAVLGLTTPGIPNWLPPSLWPNMEFADMIEAAKMWMDTIRIKENPHVVIGLFHAGHNASYEGQNPNDKRNENASLLVAYQVPGFDAILIGHDHDRVNTKIANCNGDSVTILDPGAYGYLVSDLSIKVEISKTGKLVKKSITGNLVDVTGMIPSPDYVARFSQFSGKVADFVDRKIGVLLSSVSTRDSYFGPSAFMKIIHSVQLNISNAQISFAAPLMFDAGINQGSIYVRDMFKLYSYENLLYIINLSGEEVIKYLEYSVSLWFETPASDNDNMIKFRKDSTGKIILHNNGKALLASSFYNFDSADGIKYQIDLSKEKGERVTIISMENGEPFDLTKQYKVALNSYRGNGGGGHLTEGVGLSREEIKHRLVSASPMDMRYYLMKWIERSGKVLPVKPDNWSVMPNEWAQKAAEWDRVLLFGQEQL